MSRIAATELQRRLRTITVEQDSVFSTTDLIGVGISPDLSYRRVKSGEWESMSHGLFRLASSSLKPSLDQQMLAANLALPGSVISGWFAAHIHGLPVLRDLSIGSVSLAVPISQRSRHLNVRRCSGPIPSQPWMTGRVANPVLTIVTIAALGARVGHIETVLDSALTKRLITVERVEKLLATPGWGRFPGRGLLIQLLNDRGDGSALFRSRTEAKVGSWLRDQLPVGLPNFEVDTPFGPIEVDRAWPEAKLALEISPFWTHGSRNTQERDVDRRHALRAAQWNVVEADDRHLVNRRAFRPILSLLRSELGRSGKYPGFG
jgi:hypothetical protein